MFRAFPYLSTSLKIEIRTVAGTSVRRREAVLVLAVSLDGAAASVFYFFGFSSFTVVRLLCNNSCAALFVSDLTYRCFVQVFSFRA